MDVFDAIFGRRSIRDYENDEIPESVIYKAIDAARHAPSAGNFQPWEFIIVRDAEIKKKLYSAAFSQSQILSAPVVIVVCADVMRSAYYGIRGTNLYAIQDTSAAIQNMLLAFYAMGYGTCWVGAFSEQAVKDCLNLPSEVRPVAIITVGKPRGKADKRELRNIEEIVHFDLWGNKSSEFFKHS